MASSSAHGPRRRFSRLVGQLRAPSPCAGSEGEDSALLKAYLRRIGCSEAEVLGQPLSPGHLALLQRRHVHAVPFENLDMWAEPKRLHIEVPLIEKTVRKLAESGRGGFCHELNSSFGWLLTQLGYRVTKLNGKFSLRTEDRKDYEHHILLVSLPDGQRFLTDAGNQLPNTRCSTLEPLSLDKADAVQLQPFREGGSETKGHAFRVVPVAPEEYNKVASMVGAPEWPVFGYKFLQAGTTEDWRDNYFFNLQPHDPADYQETANWQQTGEDSFFRRGLLCTMPATFKDKADLAARLGCAVEAVDLPNEAVDPAEGGHCQLSLTGTFEKGARLRAFCSRTGRTVFDTTFATRTQAYQCLRHTFGLSTLPFPEER